MSATKEHHHFTRRSLGEGGPKERPILFTPEMVRAILDGRKTQTRRIIKPAIGWDHNWNVKKAEDSQNGYCMRCNTQYSLPYFKCPYGIPGDHLYVREKYLQWQYRDGEKGEIAYFDDPQIDALKRDMENLKKQKNTGNWRVIPSIHMPRAATRITLLITDITPQRLHDITPFDARAEGIQTYRPVPGDGAPETLYRNHLKDTWVLDPIYSYYTLWEKINGPGSWDRNPWVWVIHFQKI